MTCKRSKQCDHADLCRFAQSDDYNLLGGSCFVLKDPQTNEEWLKHCNTEQLAKWLSNHSAFIYECGQKQVAPKTMYEEDWEWWLKQPHKE